MRSALAGVGFEQAIESQAFASGAEQCQEDDRQRAQQPEAVTSLRIGDTQCAHAHAEAKILFVAEPRLDGPPFGVVVDDLARGAIAEAGGDAPGLLHPLGVDANDGADFAPGGGEFDIA